MKKLISILGAMGIVASSATAVIACGGNGGNNEKPLDSDVQSALDATSDITKAMLLAKSENIGVNHLDILDSQGTKATNSVNIINRFKSASDYQDINEYWRDETDKANNWTNNFGTISHNEENGNFSVRSFIDQSKIVKTSDNANDIDKSLDYLLSDDEMGFINNGTYAKKDDITNLWTPNKDESVEDTDRLDFKTDAYSAAQSNKFSGAGLLASLGNFSPDKMETVITLMDTIGKVGAIDGMPKFSMGGSNTGGDGDLRTFFFFDSPSSGLNKQSDANITLGGDITGIATTSFESIYNIYMKNKDKIINGNENIKKLFELVVGDTDVQPNDSKSENYRLIGDIADGSTNFKDRGIDDDHLPGMNSSIKWFESYYHQSDSNIKSQGILGDLIDAIGDLDFHRLDNSGRVGNEKLTGDHLGNANYNNMLMTDNDFVKVMELTFKLYEITKKIVPDDITKTIFSTLYSNQLSTAASLLGFAGIKVDENSAPIVLDLFMKVGEAFLDYDGTEISANSSVEDVQSYINDDSHFGLQTVHAIQDAGQFAEGDSAGTKWSDNEQYRNAFYKAIGVKSMTDTNFEPDSFGAKLKNIFKNVDLSGFVASINGYTWLNNLYDQQIIGENKWNSSDVSFTRDELGTITSIKFKLEYKGLGNQLVSDYKAKEAEKSERLTQSQIFNNLANDTNDENSFKNNYLGYGLEKELVNVDHFYTIEWKNESSDSSYYDFKLIDISNSMTKDENGQIVEMII